MSGYDSACRDLAQTFLEAEDHTSQDVEHLALCIQNAIEDWFWRWEDGKENAQKSR